MNDLKTNLTVFNVLSTEKQLKIYNSLIKASTDVNLIASSVLTKTYQMIGEVTIYNGGYGNITARLYARYTEQSITGNYSNVQVKLTHYMPANNQATYWSSSGTITGDVTGSYTGTTNKVYYPGELTLIETTKSIQHNDDGTKTIKLGGSFTDSLHGTKTISQVSCTLPTIARKSSISCSSPFNISDNVTLNINTKNRNFRHTIRYSFEGSSERVIATNVDDVYSWATPSEMYTDGNMENQRSGNGYLTVETFNGGQSLGVSDKFNFTANVTNSEPTVTATIVDSNATIVNYFTGNNTIFIKGLSNAEITAVATMRNGASMKSYRVTCADGKSSETYPTTTLNGVTSSRFDFYVTDSRDFSGSNTVNVAMKDYFAPYATSVEIKRKEATSTEIIANISGFWWNDNFGIKANTLKYSYRTRTAGGSWGDWTNDATLTTSGNNFSISGLSLGTDFATTTSYDIQFRLKDEVNYYNLNTENVTVSQPIIEVYPDEVAFLENISVHGNVIPEFEVIDEFDE